MRLIDTYETVQWEYSLHERKRISEGNFKIKEELCRPDWIKISLEDESIVQVLLFPWGNVPNILPVGYNVHIKSLHYFPEHQNLKNQFTQQEFEFLSNTFEFSIVKESLGRTTIRSDNSQAHELYSSTGQIVLVEGPNGKKIVLVYFSRWQMAIQPRGAAEDQLGEDLTYIHGIWEDPWLPESIIEKIKAT